MFCSLTATIAAAGLICYKLAAPTPLWKYRPISKLNNTKKKAVIKIEVILKRRERARVRANSMCGATFLLV